LFSECTSVRVASMSKTTGPVPLVNFSFFHTRARTSANPACTEASVSAVRSSVKVRYKVESEHTSAKRPSSARRNSISLQHSPPPASITMA